MKYKTPILAALCMISTMAFGAELASSPSPEQALKLLMAGNKKFVSGEYVHKDLAQEVANLKEGQTPFAVIIGCSDSRVPPEIIFDQGPGDLFIVRDAGNVIGPIELDSTMFAIKKLKTPLVVVLGHEDCGAVNATLNGQASVPELSNIYPLIENAIKQCKTKKGDKLENAIKCNIKQGVKTLKDQPGIAELIKAKKLKVIGAYFDFESRKVITVE